MHPILQLDQSFFLWLNSLHADWLDPIMFWISDTNIWIPFYLLLLFWVYQAVRKKIWGFILTLVILIALTDGVTSHLMKPYFQRPRPTHDEQIRESVHIVHEYRGGQYGFASSHAANAFGLATFLWLLFRTKWKFVGALFIWAALVSYSRIYLGVHYPLDILVGALLGVLFALLMVRVYFFYDKYQNKNHLSNT